MSLDPNQFRSTMGLLATGVAVIAAEVDGQVHAMTVNAVTSLSLDPMLMLFCPGKRARFSALLPRLQEFSINFLRSEQQALSTYFAGGQKVGEPPSFRFITHHGTPRLQGSLSALICVPNQVLDGGDHWLVTARVLHVHRGLEPHLPLLFFKGQYRRIDSTQSTPAPDIGATTDEPALMYYHP